MPMSSRNMAFSSGSIWEISSSADAQITSTSAPSLSAISRTGFTRGSSASSLPRSSSPMLAA